MRLERQMILRTQHQMGLQRMKSPPLNDIVCEQGTNPFLSPPPPPAKQQDQSNPHVKPNYGAKKQYAQEEDDSPILDKAGKKLIQEVCWVFLFLAWTVDGGLPPALSSLASQQANLTEKTIRLCKQFLDFMATLEEAILTYCVSNMVLTIYSSVLYLSELKAHSHAGCHMFMARKDKIPFNNGSSSTSHK